MTTSRRLAPWPADHPLGRPGPERPPGPIVDGLISLEWDVSDRNAASTSGAARVETFTTGIPEFAGTHRLRHVTFTSRWIRDAGAADAGIPDATGTTCSRSDEDDGASINARVPFPDHRDHQEALAGDPVAYPMGPREAPRDPQVEAGDPAPSVTRPPPAIVPSPILEGQGKLPGNAQRLPLLRRAALV